MAYAETAAEGIRTFYALRLPFHVTTGKTTQQDTRSYCQLRAARGQCPTRVTELCDHLSRAATDYSTLWGVHTAADAGATELLLSATAARSPYRRA
jgi:hypothetical protein